MTLWFNTLFTVYRHALQTKCRRVLLVSKGGQPLLIQVDIITMLMLPRPIALCSCSS